MTIQTFPNVFEGRSHPNRDNAAREAWVKGFQRLAWAGEIFQVLDQGRKVQRTGLLDMGQTFQNSTDCEQFCGEGV